MSVTPEGKMPDPKRKRSPPKRKQEANDQSENGRAEKASRFDDVKYENLTSPKEQQAWLRWRLDQINKEDESSWLAWLKTRTPWTTRWTEVKELHHDRDRLEKGGHGGGAAAAPPGHLVRAFPAATFPETFTSQVPELPAPGHPLIGIQPVVDEVIKNVKKHCISQPAPDRIAARIPPVMIASMARSGKTTLLNAAYDELVASGDFEPVIVTFNGQSGFQPRDDEEPIVGFCRGIYEQLVGEKNCQAPSVEALMGYLATCTKPLVLLVDELNSLTSEVDAELASLLRTRFLDLPNRYLVFTCHHQMSLSDAIGKRGTEDSPRQCVRIGVPESMKIQDYTAIFTGARQISPVEIALWGGLCGLAWSIACTEFQAYRYLNDKLLNFPADNMPADSVTHLAFVKQICNGTQHPKMKRYLRFTHLSKKGEPIWPLCYIAAFLTCAGRPTLSDFLKRVTEEVSSMEQRTGIEWQAIVLAAVAIRIHSASIADLDTHVADVIGPVQKDTQFRILQLPHEVVDVAGAEAYVRSHVTVRSRLVVLAFATHASFEIFDGLIIHVDGGKFTVRHGLQSKQGKTGVRSDVPEGWRGFLFRGRAPQRTRTVNVSGWVYMTEGDLTDFVPVSLRGLIPQMWPSGK